MFANQWRVAEQRWCNTGNSISDSHRDARLDSKEKKGPTRRELFSRLQFQNNNCGPAYESQCEACSSLV